MYITLLYPQRFPHSLSAASTLAQGITDHNEADARTQIGKSLAMKPLQPLQPLQAGIPGLIQALGRRGRLVGTLGLSICFRPISLTGVAQLLANITQEAKILKDLKTSAAPQTPNAPNAPDAIQLKFGLSD